MAFVFGFAAAFSFPPMGLIPLVFVSFPAFVLLLQGLEKRDLRGFALVSWCFAFGLLIPSLYWIAGALFVDLASYGWILPFAVAGLPALLALYYALAGMAIGLWGRIDRLDGVLFVGLIWFLADMARAHFFTGFPWNIIGYIWSDSLPLLQVTSVIGIEGLTLVSLWLAVLPALFFTNCSRKTALVCFFCGVVILGLLYAWGAWRLWQAPLSSVPDVTVRVVQPQTPQATKWDPAERLQNLKDLVQLSFAKEGLDRVTHFIWPETALAYYLAEEETVRDYIASFMPEESLLITGVVRRQFQNKDRPLYFNSLVVMDHKARLVAGYDKHHLVPFGEYLPFRSILPDRLTTFVGQSFTAGDGIRTIRAPRFPAFSALVCYEAIFSGQVAERDDPPALLVNVTNDAWYEGTIGPAQHFLISRVRGIEEGLPMIRSANRGVTAVTDAYGRVWAMTAAHLSGYVDSPLPIAAPTPTIMVRYGNYFLILGVLASFVVVVCYRLKNGRESKKI